MTGPRQCCYVSSCIFSAQSRFAKVGGLEVAWQDAAYAALVMLEWLSVCVAWAYQANKHLFNVALRTTLYTLQDKRRIQSITTQWTVRAWHTDVRNLSIMLQKIDVWSRSNFSQSDMDSLPLSRAIWIRPPLNLVQLKHTNNAAIANKYFSDMLGKFIHLSLIRWLICHF